MKPQQNMHLMKREADFPFLAHTEDQHLKARRHVTISNAYRRLTQKSSVSRRRPNAGFTKPMTSVCLAPKRKWQKNQGKESHPLEPLFEQKNSCLRSGNLIVRSFWMLRRIISSSSQKCSFLGITSEVKSLNSSNASLFIFMILPSFQHRLGASYHYRNHILATQQLQISKFSFNLCPFLFVSPYI